MRGNRRLLRACAEVVRLGRGVEGVDVTWLATDLIVPGGRKRQVGRLWEDLVLLADQVQELGLLRGDGGVADAVYDALDLCLAAQR